MAIRPIRARDPRPHLLAGFVSALLTWLAVIYWIGPTSGADLTPIANLLAYGIGFLFSAYVGMHIYFFTTAQSQDRQFRQEYTTKHVEEIYTPLYDEIARVVESLNEYQMPRLEEWPKKKGTHYSFFVDDEIRTALDQLEAFLAKDVFEAHISGTKAASKTGVQEFRKALGVLLLEDRYSSLQSHVSGDWKFVYDPTLKLPQAYMRSQVRGTLGNVDGSLQPEQKLDALFEAMKATFEGLPEIQGFRRVRDQALGIAVPLQAMLKDRVLRPYELRT
jgi:hypothetical protein